MPKGVPAKFNKQKVGVKVKTKSGKTFTLLNPSEKGAKAAVELRSGRNIYTGEYLSDTQLAFRSGYLAAQKDSAQCFNAKRKKRR